MADERIESFAALAFGFAALCAVRGWWDAAVLFGVVGVFIFRVGRSRS
jgi:hypothetical protein